jgi:hypothetical protein
LSAPTVDVPSRIKFKRLDKTARHIMQLCIYIYIYIDLFLFRMQTRYVFEYQ